MDEFLQVKEVIFVMPIVKVYTGPFYKDTARELAVFCQELVPAVLNSKEGPLQPSLVMVTHQPNNTELSVDILIDVEAFDFPDRSINLDERTDELQRALTRILSNSDTRWVFQTKYTCAVWIKLVKAGYSSNKPDLFQPKVSMTIDEAIKRFYNRLGLTG